MYLDHFGFHAPPFAITPDTELFFSGGERGAILEQLLQAIAAGEGFIKVVGEVGSGKTMLCRLMCRKLPTAARVALLLNPGIPPEELIGALLREFRLPPMTEEGQAARHQALLEFLVTRQRQGERAVIVVEEAQSLPPATLEALRLISNLETEQVKLVSIVLFGQPALDRMLHSGIGRQILERITTHLTLPRLSLDDTEQYLHNRLHTTGYRGPPLFSPGAVRRIHQSARGAIRQINLLAEKSLVQASRQGAHSVASRHVQQGISRCAFLHRIPVWRRPALAAAGVVTLLTGSMAMHSWAIHLPALPLSLSALSVPRPAATTVEPGQPMAQPPQMTQQPRQAGDSPASRIPSTLSEATSARATLLTLARTLTIPPPSLARVAENASAPLSTTPLVARTRVLPPFPAPVVQELVSLPENQNHADPMRERVRAAHRWLEASHDTRYTIQLIHLSHDTGIHNLDKALADAQPDLSARKLKIFRLRNQRLMVYLGEFDNETSAQEALQRLPSNLRSGNPRVMPLERVKTIVRDHTQPDCQSGQENSPCVPSA
ncbi:MAG: AAA family ATPase [Magnetococcales bacterium]|nr:AAA family ATPase [Magnetococcales bacterium]